MKKALAFVLFIFYCICGHTQTIDPVLALEMRQRSDDEKIKVVVIMKSQYDRQQLGRSAAHYASRAERREFVVNELKRFAESTQHELRSTLSEMERQNMATTPKIIWMANALYFSASKQAINDLSNRRDIEIIGLDEEKYWLFDEESRPASNIRGITPNVTQVNADQVWDLGYTGQGVVVAVIDTGVNYNHLDLADHLWDGGSEYPNHGYDFINEDNDPMDDHGHGTHCAGTLCGDGTAGLQTGIAPDATLMCVKVLRSDGYGTSSVISDAMQWVVEQGCDLFSMSLGNHDPSLTERMLFRNICMAILDAGVVGAVSAGNMGEPEGMYYYPIPNNVDLPGSCPPPYMDSIQVGNPGGLSCVVCVGAVDEFDNAPSFTSRGPVTWADTEFADYPYWDGSNTEFGLIRPDVCAPGVGIISANAWDNTGYAIRSGTSMSTPCVAGCISLMLSKNINVTPAEICRILEETAVSLEEGKSNTYGFGRVDALAAINAVYKINPLTLEAFTINDEQGNSDSNLNAGETVTLSLTLKNDSAIELDNATLVLSSTSGYVTITDDTVALPHFEAGQIQTIENSFVFTLSDDAAWDSPILFTVNAFIDGESIGFFTINIMVYGYELRFDEVKVLNDDNGNGSLEPGETADLQVIISNVGNGSATSIVGTLSTTFPYLTFNEATKTFGDIEVNEQTSADFNVTLAGDAPNNCIIDFSLDLVDENEKHNHLDFELLEGIIQFADSTAKSICVSLWDTNGDGELSYAEAVSITDLGRVFEGKNITSFDELQYFTGLTFIGHFAFHDCSLTAITIPNSVTSIGNFAFYNCTGLTSVSFGNSVTSIGSEAFLACSGLTSISIPSSVTSIGTDVFYGCSGLEQIVVNEGNTVYDSRSGCNAIITTANNELIIGCKNTVIPNSVTSIGNSAFSGCIGLTAITIPNSVTSIGNSAFYYCIGLTEITIPNSVAFIGNSAFYNCIDLFTLTIGNSVTSIDAFAFYGCSSLFFITSLAIAPPVLNYSFGSSSSNLVVNVPCGLEDAYGSISWGGFNNFQGLCGGTVTVVALPEEGGTVTGGGIFEAGQACTVTATPFEGYVVEWTINGIVVSNNIEYTFYVANDITVVAHFERYGNVLFADANVEAICVSYWDTDGDGELSYAEVEAVTSLDNCFRGNAEITSFDELQYFTGLSSIGSNDFENCTGLESIVLPKHITSIDSNAFYHCSGLTGHLTIPNSVISIGGTAFDNCIGLTSLTIGNAVTSIGRGAFFLCVGLDSVCYTGDIHQWCNIQFGGDRTNPLYYAHNLYINNELVTDLVIPETITVIGDYAFQGATCLTSLTIPNSITWIGYNAFSYCSGIFSITSLAETAPANHQAFGSLSSSTFVFVPCGFEDAYTSVSWGGFSNFHGMCEGTVTVAACPEVGGTVEGNGTYEEGQTCTVMATPHEGFVFTKWTLNGLKISNNPEYTFHVAGDMSFVACFVPEGDIVFADTLVKSICISYWDTNGDGELSYVEAAAVTSLGEVFRNNAYIGSFDELQYFIGLPSIGCNAFRDCSGLTSIVLPEFIASIDDDAFFSCSGLTGSLTIPYSVISIGLYAFSKCYSLTSITMLAEMPPLLEGNAFFNVNDSILVYVPCGSLAAYQSAAYWNEFTNIQEDCLPPQTLQLVQGWNWFSANVDITLDDLKAALVEAMPGITIKIKGKDNNTAYNPNTHRWFGTLTWNLSQMYKIQATDACEITLQGLPVDLAELPITIVNGANWIAFPLSEGMSLTNAFDGFAVNGDVVKSKEGTATYIRGRWQGQSLTTLEPGQGYIYISNETDNRIFIFPTSTK